MKNICSVTNEGGVTRRCWEFHEVFITFPMKWHFFWVGLQHFQAIKINQWIQWSLKSHRHINQVPCAHIFLIIKSWSSLVFAIRKEASSSMSGMVSGCQKTSRCCLFFIGIRHSISDLPRTWAPIGQMSSLSPRKILA